MPFEVIELGAGKPLLSNWLKTNLSRKILPDAGTDYVITPPYKPSAALLNKLLPANRRNLGSKEHPGTVITSGLIKRKILFVVNEYLINKLTEQELKEILDHRALFEFTIGVGDRRNDLAVLYSRFEIATNWHGEDVNGLILTPDPFANMNYRHTLTFNGDEGTISVTDSHSSPNNYGSIRYFTISKK